MRGETMKDKSKKSTYSTTFVVDPTFKFTYKATDTDRQKTSAKGQIISNANKLFSVQIK